MAQVYFDDNSGTNLFLPAKTHFSWQKVFCQSGFYHWKNGFFHLLAKTSQPCNKPKHAIVKILIQKWSDDINIFKCLQIFPDFEMEQWLR